MGGSSPAPESTAPFLQMGSTPSPAGGLPTAMGSAQSPQISSILPQFGQSSQGTQQQQSPANPNDPTQQMRLSILQALGGNQNA